MGQWWWWRWWWWWCNTPHSKHRGGSGSVFEGSNATGIQDCPTKHRALGGKQFDAVGREGAGGTIWKDPKENTTGLLRHPLHHISHLQHQFTIDLRPKVGTAHCGGGIRHSSIPRRLARARKRRLRTHRVQGASVKGRENCCHTNDNRRHGGSKAKEASWWKGEAMTTTWGMCRHSATTLHSQRGSKT